MTYRLAKLFGVAGDAKNYEELSSALKALYDVYPYIEIIRPLVLMDKKNNSAISYRTLEVRYGINHMTIYRIIQNQVDFVKD